MINLSVPKDIYNKINVDLDRLKERIELFSVKLEGENQANEKKDIHKELLQLNYLVKKFLYEMLFDKESNFFKMESESLNKKLDYNTEYFLKQLSPDEARQF